jgi:hypothetical protein
MGAVLSEGGQEMLTEALQIGRDVLQLGDDISAREAIQRIIDAGIIGGLMGAGGGVLSFKGPADEGKGPPPTPESAEDLLGGVEGEPTPFTEETAGPETTPFTEEGAVEVPEPVSSREKVEGVLTPLEEGIETIPYEPDKPFVEAPEPLQAGFEDRGEATRRVEATERIAAQEERLKDVTLPPNFGDARLKREGHRQTLESMASELVKGGDGAGALIYDDQGGVSGRLGSVNAEWFQTMAAQADTKASVEQVKAAVDKALAGEKLGVRQARIIGTMLDAIGEERGTRIDYVKEQLAQARIERQGFAPVSVYDEADAGQIFEEEAYEADWDGPTRTLAELHYEAEQVDAAAVEALSDSLEPTDAARALTEIIARQHEQEVQEPAAEGELETGAGPDAQEPEGQVPAEAAPATPRGYWDAQLEQNPLREKRDKNAAEAWIAGNVEAAGDILRETAQEKSAPDYIQEKLSRLEMALANNADWRAAEAQETTPEIAESLKRLEGLPTETYIQRRVKDLVSALLNRQRAEAEAALVKLKERINAVQPETVPPVRGEGEPGGERAEGLEGALPGREAGEEAQEEDQGRAKIRISLIPAEATVTRKAIVEETGDEVTITQNAREAVRELEKQRTIYQKLMDCVSA